MGFVCSLKDVHADDFCVLGTVKCVRISVTLIFLDALCATLSDAIMSGRQDQSAEIARKMATQNLHLSIKLKNPTLVTMDSGGNTIK